MCFYTRNNRSSTSNMSMPHFPSGMVGVPMLQGVRHPARKITKHTFSAAPLRF